MPPRVVCSYPTITIIAQGDFFCQVLKSNNQTFFCRFLTSSKSVQVPPLTCSHDFHCTACISYSINIEEKVLFSECDLLCKFSFFCSTTTLSSALTEAPFPNHIHVTVRFSVDTTLLATVKDCFHPLMCLVLLIEGLCLSENAMPYHHDVYASQDPT